jgi:hypothetical protein
MRVFGPLPLGNAGLPACLRTGRRVRKVLRMSQVPWASWPALWTAHPCLAVHEVLP